MGLVFMCLHQIIGNVFCWQLLWPFPHLDSNFPQNKILHNRLEALHIKLAENDRDSAGISSGNSIQDPLLDTGLHNVVNYLRRSKEIVCVSHPLKFFNF